MSHKGQERFAKGKHNMSHTGSFVQRAGEVCKCVLLSNSDLERGISQTDSELLCCILFPSGRPWVSGREQGATSVL